MSDDNLIFEIVLEALKDIPEEKRDEVLLECVEEGLIEYIPDEPE